MLSLAIAGLVLAPIAHAITPEQMLAAPRRSVASPNSNGEWALYSATSYSWEEHETSTTWNLLNVASGEITELEWDGTVSEVAWVGETETSVLYINESNPDVDGGITIWAADLAATPIEGTLVAALPAPYSGLKAVKTESGDINFIVNCLADAKDGTAYNEELATEPDSSARLYESNFIRHWDTYMTHERFAVFSGVLSRGYGGNAYGLNGEMRNLLKEIEAPITRPESPVQPFGDLGDYDLSPDGSQVAFLSKAPELPKANYTASYIFLVPHDGSSVAKAINGPGSSAPEAAQGASGAPRFSPDGTKLAYYQQDGIYYESDKSKLYVIDLESSEISPLADDWDRSIGQIQWNREGDSLYVSAESLARVQVFIIPADADSSFKPENITGVTSVTDYAVLPDGSVLVSASSLISPRDIYVASAEGEAKYLFRANEVDPELEGLKEGDYEDMWYEGSTGDRQHAMVARPTDFDPSKKYSLAFIVHGGPQGYSGNAWSTRWNARVWADQGYVVVLPNPTGSTSFGQELTDRIQANWASYPYEDLVKAHAHIEANLDYVDVENGICAGASYGGFMTNWIQGHDLGRRFKALVSHDGVSATLAHYGTEELWFIHHDFNGTVWDARETYVKWDPMDHAANFSTPHFVVHSDLDYRLPVAEGIALFNALQQLGVPSRMLNFPDENHWVLNRENSKVWHNEIFNWINFWTGKVEALSDNVIRQ